MKENIKIVFSYN